MPEIQSLPGMTGVLNPLDAAQLRSDEARKLFESEFEGQSWLDDYYELLGEGWSWRQAFFIIWASLPKSRREPRRQYELADVLGLESDRRIRQWRAENPAIQNRIDQLSRTALARARPAIYDALIEAASNPSPRAHADRKLALEMMGDYTPKQNLSVGPLESDVEAADASDLAAQAQIPVVSDDE